MAIVHDMAECIVGDIAPFQNIPKQEKLRKEQVGKNNKLIFHANY